MNSIVDAVIVSSKEEFEKLLKRNFINDSNVELYKDFVFISINDFNKSSYFNEDHSNVLRLFFDDIAEPTDSEKECIRLGIYKIFDDEQARKVIDFIIYNDNQNTDVSKTYIVHCAAGISRSGAIGEFLSDIYEISWEEFKRMNPKVHPNSHIIKTLKKNYAKNYQI